MEWMGGPSRRISWTTQLSLQCHWRARCARAVSVPLLVDGQVRLSGAATAGDGWPALVCASHGAARPRVWSCAVRTQHMHAFPCASQCRHYSPCGTIRKQQLLGTHRAAPCRLDTRSCSSCLCKHHVLNDATCRPHTLFVRATHRIAGRPCGGDCDARQASTARGCQQGQSAWKTKSLLFMTEPTTA